ncbi:MAG TPA: DEAD/DEAH box helicase [Microlunatus sp.]|nr:DEAD/DEAH box helicase [Microlunatus sp.]
MAVDVPTNQPTLRARSETEMSGKTSGAPARARSNKTTTHKTAAKGAKSAKADGTPKQRWTAAERRESGRPPRRSAGRQYEDARSEGRAAQGRDASDNRYGSRGSDARRYDRDDRPRTSRDDRSSSERYERKDRPSGNRDGRYGRDDRPSSNRYERNDGPRAERGNQRTDGYRSDRPRNDRGGTDRGWNDRGGDRPRQDRRFDDRQWSDRGSARGRSDDRWTSSAPESDQMSWEAPSADVAPSAAPSLPPTSGGFGDLGLPKALVAALQSGGITEPFPIQAATIPDALAGRDVLGRGKTGSGKTLGFGLPMITNLSGSNAPSHCARSLVLVPTRELALQVADVLAPLARIQGLSLTLVAGGMAYGPQLKAFERGVDIVVATPGRLIDLMDQGAADLTRVEVVVLDEADHMADLGFMPAVTQILDTVPAGGQRLLFSATLDGAVNRLVKRYLSDPVTHEVDPGQASVSSMEHHVLHVRPADKAPLTAEIAGRDGRTVVFVRTQRGADRVAEQLRDAGVLAGALHGGLTQGARARMLASFKDGRLPVLVATDVAARGIHVDEVGLVLQVDPPAGPKDYLHRAGRTARAGETGVVVTLALPHQRREVERLTRQAGVQALPLSTEPGDALMVAATGARVPSGPAVSQQEFDKLVSPPVRTAKRRPGQGHRGRHDSRGGSAGRRPRY